MAKNFSKQSGSRSRNQSGNNIYSINYKFDSISIAGKYTGNALELIKKYNELAKEAFGEQDIIKAETFRQYAEHYRKIVTDINEKKVQKNIRRPRDEYAEISEVSSEETFEEANELTKSPEVVEIKEVNKEVETTDNIETKERKSGKLKIVEIKSANEKDEDAKPKRRGRPAGAKNKLIIKKEEIQKEAS